MSRELDAACARAMGWTRNKYWHGPDGDARLSGMPKFSTDPATDAEKVAWLRKRLDGGRIECCYWADGGNEAETAGTGAHAFDRHGSGATMTEALAKLVIAVAEAEARK